MRTTVCLVYLWVDASHLEPHQWVRSQRHPLSRHPVAHYRKQKEITVSRVDIELVQRRNVTEIKYLKVRYSLTIY
jgi:hypothetical protein